jgi:hypothetical protein
MRSLYLSVCNGGVTIATAEQRWASQGYESPIKGRGVGIGVYETRPGSGWERVARRLIDRLEKRWPGKVRFRGGGGELVPTPKVLSSGALTDEPAT